MTPPIVDSKFGGVNPTRRNMERRARAIQSGEAAKAIPPQARGPGGRGKDIAVLVDRALQSGMTSLVPFLPMMMSIRGQPYTLSERPFYEAFYRTVQVPVESDLTTGRQAGKSMFLASLMLGRAVVIAEFSQLYVAPLFEMTRRFSHNYARKLIEESPIRDLIVGTGAASSVLQKELSNGSSMHFTYASTDAERSRGLPIDATLLDEKGNMDYDLISLLHQTMRNSPWKIKQYAGTPKGYDNAAYKLRQDSSQAEWAMKCRRQGCGHWNFPCLSHDLLDMIGPYRADISRKEPGLVCAKCRKPISPRLGTWVHGVPERKLRFPGYHVSQTIVPDTCESPEEWASLLADMGGANNMTFPRFLQEVCGESYDEGGKPVTMQDLKAASVLDWPNKRTAAVPQAKRYKKLFLSIDWGGGGGAVPGTAEAAKNKPRTSWTCYSVLGLNPRGGVDVIYGHRSLKTHDPLYEAILAARLAKEFRCARIVHDFSYAGSQQEIFLRQAGWPADKIIGVRYTRPNVKDLVTYHEPGEDGSVLGYYGLIKAVSLGFTCEAIKAGYIRFFKDDLDNVARPSVVTDFLALVESRIESETAADMFLIRRNPLRSDDFAQAVNIGAHMLWYSESDPRGTKGKRKSGWPVLVDASRFAYTAAQLDALDPAEDRIDWGLVN